MAWTMYDVYEKIYVNEEGLTKYNCLLSWDDLLDATDTCARNNPNIKIWAICKAFATLITDCNGFTFDQFIGFDYIKLAVDAAELARKEFN